MEVHIHLQIQLAEHVLMIVHLCLNMLIDVFIYVHKVSMPIQPITVYFQHNVTGILMGII